MISKYAKLGLVGAALTFTTSCSLFDSNDKKTETSSSSATQAYDTAAVAKILDKTDTAMFNSLKEVMLSFKHSEKLWESKYRLDQTPLLMVRSDKDRNFIHGLLINHPNPKAVDSNAIELNALGDGLPKIYLIKKPIQALQDNFKDIPWFDFMGDVAGTKTMRMRYFSRAIDSSFTPEQNPGFAKVIIHEGFHRHQVEGNFLKVVEMPQVSAPLDSASLAYTILEEEILRQSLGSAEVDFKTHLKRLIAVRTKRISLAQNPKFEQYQNSQERIEGTARYIEYIFDSLKVNSLGPINWTGTNWNNFLVLRHIAEYKTNHPGLKEEYSFGRYYSTGSLIGLILDRLGVNWKSDVATELSPMEVLKKSITMTDAELDAALKEAETEPKYDFEKLKTYVMPLLSKMQSQNQEESPSSQTQSSIYPAKVSLVTVDAAHTPKYLPQGSTLLGMSINPSKDYMDGIRLFFSPQGNDVTLIQISTQDNDTLQITQSGYTGSFDDWKANLNMFGKLEIYENYNGQSIFYFPSTNGLGGLFATVKNGRVTTLNSQKQVKSESLKVLEGIW